MNTSLNRAALLVACGTAMATLVVYTMTLPRTITLEDAGLFQMVCHLGGIGHPPGYPLFVLGCQQFVNLPFFDNSVFAANFLSSIYASLSVAIAVLLALQLRLELPVAAAVGLAYGFSLTFWSQAIIVEVYSLASLTILLCLLLSLLFRETNKPGYLVALAFCGGLALSNHWPLLGLALPAVACVLLAEPRLLFETLYKPLVLLSCVIALLAGLTPYLSLFQAEDGFSVYGRVGSFEEFVPYVLREAYNDDFATAGTADRLQYQLWLAEESALQLGLVALPLILLGVYRSFAVVGTSGAWMLLALYLGATSLLNLLINFEFTPFRQAIFRPYPVAAYVSLAIWFGFGLQLLVQLLNKYRVARRYEYGLLVVLVASVFLSNLGQNSRGQIDWVDRFARELLYVLPENAILFAQGDSWVGPLGYLHYVEGVRPDIELRAWDHLVFPNRLGSPYLPEDQSETITAEFIGQASSPVFLTFSSGLPTVDHGLVYEVDKAYRTGFSGNRESHEFIQYLVTLYDEDLLVDGHEQELLYSLLLNLARQHVGLVHLVDGAGQAERDILSLLQSTVPGRLATLETLLIHGTDDKQLLENMAEGIEAEVADLSLRRQAIYLEYRARTALLEPASRDAAVRYFMQSIARYPHSSNTSLCPLIGLYGSDDQEDKAAALRLRYPDLICGG